MAAANNLAYYDSATIIVLNILQYRPMREGLPWSVVPRGLAHSGLAYLSTSAMRTTANSFIVRQKNKNKMILNETTKFAKHFI